MILSKKSATFWDHTSVESTGREVRCGVCLGCFLARGRSTLPIVGLEVDLLPNSDSLEAHQEDAARPLRARDTGGYRKRPTEKTQCLP